MMNETNNNNTAINNNVNLQNNRFTQDTRTITFMLIVSVICGILFPMIIVEYDAALNYFLCAFCLIASMAYTLVKSKDYKLPQLIFWTIIALVYTSTFLRFRNVTYLVFSFLLTPVIFTLMIYFTRSEKRKNTFAQLAETFFSPLVHGFKVLPAVSRIRTSGTKSKALIEILVGILVSAVLLAIIVPLMFSADVQFGNYIKDFTDRVFDDFFDNMIGKIMLAVFIIIVYFGYLYMATKKINNAPQKAHAPSKGISTNIIITVLCVVTFVYAVFTCSALFNIITQNANNLPEHMTYAEYAREGFFQLTWLTIINFLLLLGAQLSMQNKTNRAKLTAKVIFTIQVIINLCLLGLSFYKMNLYASAYGLTLLRVFVYIILAYELVLLGMLMYKIYNEKFKFITNAVYFSFAFWAIVSFINMENYIVKYNSVNIPVEDFDCSYVSWNLSADASSAFKDFVIENYDELDKKDINNINNYFRLDIETRHVKDRKWFEYNISYSRYLRDRNELLKFLETK